MNESASESAWFAPLVAAAADVAAKRELAAVRGAVASGEVNALAKAFHGHRDGLAKLMGWSDERTDRYCMKRLQQLAADGITAGDLVFVQGATAQLIQHHDGEVQ